MTGSPRARALPLTLALAGAVWGTIVAVHYARLDLSLAHYDARGHLIVARRIFDSITPGWQQIGAVWLPLPHLLNAIPVQVDLFYRTGASAIAISVACFALSIGAIAAIIERLTSSKAAALAGCAVFALNPNVLYLQATPMTEPLLVALLLLSLALLLAWCEDVIQSKSDAPSAWTGAALALACLTRYEAWPVTITALALATWALFRAGFTPRLVFDRIRGVAIYPASAIAAFFVFSRVVSGSWFADDFFIPENPAQGSLFEAISEIVWGVRELSGLWLLVLGVSGALLLIAIGVVARRRAAALIPLALMTTAAVPFAAFIDGHPYRIRYMVPLIAAEAVLAGALASVPVGRRVIAAIVLSVAIGELRPLALQAPMVVEAQWDRPNITAREPVSACLADAYDGTCIMASMGSLGHYMQSLSRRGFALRNFLHEGNGDIWLNALIDPRPYAGWILIEEKAEGGDMLARLSRERPQFLKGYTRVCAGAGVALYRRDAR